MNTEDLKEFMEYDWPFENLIFEGGGAKVISVIGTLQVLEDIGVLKKVQRYAGASGGAFAALLLSIGCTSREIEEIFKENLKEKSEDARFGIFSIIPNIILKFGMHSGDNLYEWLGTLVKAKTGDADITFKQLYQKTGKELVVTVTDIKQLDCVYCHVKTTPTMPIRKAVKMSMSIPGVMQPTISEYETFVDGGILCNYPIHCFDGWYLSMAPEDSFLRRYSDSDAAFSFMWDMKHRFGTRNDKTIGVSVYAADQEAMFKTDLQKRMKQYIHDHEIPPRPKTHLASKRMAEHLKREELLKKHNTLTLAMGRFVKCLGAKDQDLGGTISREEFEDVMKNGGPEFTDKDVKLLFGEDTSSVDQLFDKIDLDHDGEITVTELMTFAEESCLEVMKVLRCFDRPQEIPDIWNFCKAIIDTVLFHIKRLSVQEQDIDRTIGIDTAYLGAMDFDMDIKDKTYLIQQGKLGCIAFLRHYIEVNKLEKTVSDPEMVNPIIDSGVNVNRGMAENVNQ